jgi:hypothetical protein
MVENEESQTPIDDGNEWTEEDLEDVTKLSIEYANEVYPYDERELVRGWFLVSLKSFQEIWDNEEDSVYDDM